MGAREQRCSESVGPIDDNERIAKGLYSPELFDRENNTITTEAFSVSELRCEKGVVDACGTSSGVSCARMDRLDGLVELKHQLNLITQRVGSKGAREVVGYAAASVLDIESLEDGTISVIDDGHSSFRTHVVLRACGPRGKVRGARDKLIQKLNGMVVAFDDP